MAHVAKWKFKEVEALTNLLTNKPVIGVVEIGGIPAPQIQKMRTNLQNIADVRSSKNSLILRAFDEAEKKVKGISTLKDFVTGQTAILATDINPFKLFNKIKITRTNAPAKGGETVSSDIEVKAGDTPFKPGPIVGDLQKAGIPAAIQEGKVVIKKDKILVPAGEKIPKDVAQMLTRLEIFPIEIGMSIQGIFEDGSVYKPDILDIDMDEFLLNIKKASSNAFSLAIETSWINKNTIKPLLNKAYRNAFSLAIDRGIINKKTIKHLISKSHSSMISLASKSKDGLDEDLKNMMT
ncbi:MAG: 50S ribosomal protein L10 [Candidatus Thermoplasmatota archaeon]|nr:50S ribosomal protein L10 [Candidatus Thermoplasmatota archaeon]